MTEFKPRPAASPVQGRVALQRRQDHRKLLALALLLAAFAALIVKDRLFWFGSEESQEIDLGQPEVTAQNPARPVPNAIAQTRRPVAAPVAKKQAAPVSVLEPNLPSSPANVSNRTALKPLEIEVVAGDSRRRLSPASKTANVDVAHQGLSPNSRPAEFTANMTRPLNAAELEPLTRSAVHQTTASPSGPYPLLAQQMRVQGSVVLQALIGADGFIENLRVLSGPAILAAAARQAVSEWRFKPYVENGRPVETEAKITVNFTINVADGSVTTASLNTSSELIIETAE